MRHNEHEIWQSVRSQAKRTPRRGTEARKNDDEARIRDIRRELDELTSHDDEDVEF